MIRDKMIDEMQEPRLSGLSLEEAYDRLREKHRKAPHIKTVRKHHDMEAAPKDNHAKAGRRMAFDAEPLRGAVIEIMAKNPGCKMGPACDVLAERLVDEGDCDRLPGNGQTLRHLVHRLEDEGAMPQGADARRRHDSPGAPPAGERARMDFGEQRCEEGLVVHLTSILLWHSRHLWVCAQDHRLDSEEACRAIHRFTCKVGGRPRTLVIDQDSVFVTDEIYGEVSGTATFKDFLTEQDLRPWVCGKGDPESKGAMENTVKYVRSSYFSARRIASIEEAWRTPPAWNRRANRRIHQGTYKIPQVEFEDRERAAPRPMLPSFYEAAPPGLKEVSIDSQPYVPCRSARHPVPWDMCHAKACHRAIGPKPHTCDGRRRHVCVHDISPVKGPFRRLEGHKRHPASDWPGIAERMRVKWNRTDSRHLVNGSEREDQARHLGRQLGAAGRYLDERKPSRALVAEATGICCRDLRYRHAHLKAVFDLAGARHAGGGAPNAVTADATTANEAEGRGMESHRRAFEERCAL